MIFHNIIEARNYFRKYKILSEEIEEYDGEFKFGNWYLIQHIKKVKDYFEISKPILGIAVGYDVYDMALCLKFIEQPRGWMKNNHVITSYKYNLKTPIIFENDIQDFIIWYDNIFVLSTWKNKPSLKELKIALILKK
jgi:hypothetical protein